MNELGQKIAIVTGSTQGLGEAIARRLVTEKMIAGLVICGRNAENGRLLAAEFIECDCRTEFVVADLTRLEDCRNVVETAPYLYRRRLKPELQHKPTGSLANYVVRSYCMPSDFVTANAGGRSGFPA